jgi:hypothetical protein
VRKVLGLEKQEFDKDITGSVRISRTEMVRIKVKAYYEILFYSTMFIEAIYCLRNVISSGRH